MSKATKTTEEIVQARWLESKLRRFQEAGDQLGAIITCIRFGDFNKANQMIDGDSQEKTESMMQVRKMCAVSAIGENRSGARRSEVLLRWQAKEESIRSAYGLTEKDIERYKDLLRIGEFG
ncbi:MAG: hypothetical protein KGH94_04010 [Candidatus Micrarchaeota archaeon]|nr:hypothetical protein [Candidatus Micrarchaeota archaeon]